MEKDLIKQFNLPGYVKGKTFADASKAINNKFKDRDDPTSIKTKEELLSRLAKAQEYIKMQESLAANAEEVPEMQNIPEQFAEGGSMNDYLGVAKTALDFGNELFGDTGVDDSGNMQYEKVNEFGSTASGALKGVQAGTAILPGIGTAVGALAGGVSGLFGAKRKNEDIVEANNNFALSKTANLRSDFGMGGKMKYAEGGNLDDLFKVKNEAFNNAVNFEPTMATFNKAEGKGLARGVNWLSENFGNIAQYAPIVNNALELKNLDKPITERGTRMDNMYAKNLFDTNTLVNQVNQNDVNAALEEASGGDLGALRTNILAGNLNKNKAISEAMMKADQINRDEGRFKFQSDFNKDRINVSLDQNYLERKDRDMGMYETTKSNLRRQLFEDLGDIGREEVNKKLVRDMFGYKWNGKYYVDPKTGAKFTQAEVAAKIKQNKENGES